MLISKSKFLTSVILLAALGGVWSAPVYADAPKRAQIKLSDADYDAKMTEVDAILKEADQATTTGDYKTSIQMLEKALNVCQTYLGEGPYMIIVLQYLYIDYANVGDFQKAESAAKKALEIAENIYDDKNERKIQLVGNLGIFYLNLNRLAEAEPFLTRALAMTEAAHGPDAPENAYILKNVIELYQRTGRKSEADNLIKSHKLNIEQ